MQQESKALGILAIVFGGIALFGSWIPILNNLSLIIGIVALILGIVGLIINRKNKKTLAVVGTSLAVAACAIVLITQAFYLSAVNQISEEWDKTSASIEQSFSKEEVKEKEADAKFKWTDEYFKSLKEGDLGTGAGGTNYNDIVAKVGEPTEKKEDEDSLDARWTNEGGSSYKSVDLSFHKQEDGSWLLWNKVGMF